MNQKQILIVDDEDDIAEMLSFEFSRHNYAVTTCGDGIRALKLIQAQKPDLLIIDVVMPKMNGFLLVQELEKQAYDFPIVIVSGAYAQQSKNLSTTLKLLGVFPKPFSVGEIIGLVGSHFSGPV